jgi:hypothetical protein
MSINKEKEVERVEKVEGGSTVNSKDNLITCTLSRHHRSGRFLITGTPSYHYTNFPYSIST